MHAGAATAAGDLEALERGLEECKEEIGRWREGLAEVEKKITEGEGVMGRNLEVVGNWVGTLERRVKELQDGR